MNVNKEYWKKLKDKEIKCENGKGVIKQQI